MNKDYLEHQYSKSKKLTERAFKLRIAMLMVSILACAGIMASSAFALFTCKINRSTTLTAAEFEVLGWNPIQQTSDDINITHIVDIYTTPGVLGYCRIPVYGADKTIHYYFTEAFSNGHMQVNIATASGASVGKPEGYWGNPRNFLGPEAEIIGNGALVTHSYAAPEVKTSSGGGQDVSQENNANETDNKQIVDKTENNDEVIKTPMLSASPSGNKEQTTVTESVVTEKETTSVVEKSETTVTPSVSEEKASVENSDSTVTEAPVTSTPPSDNSSDSGTSDSSGANVSASDNGNSSETSSSGNSGNDGSAGTGNSSDSGNASGSVSSGTEASAGGTPTSSSDGGGE